MPTNNLLLAASAIQEEIDHLSSTSDNPSMMAELQAMALRILQIECNKASQNYEYLRNKQPFGCKN